MNEIHHKCIEEALKFKASSIAFPTIGAGQLNYPADVVAASIWDECKVKLAAVTTKLQVIEEYFTAAYICCKMLLLFSIAYFTIHMRVVFVQMLFMFPVLYLCGHCFLLSTIFEKFLFIFSVSNICVVIVYFKYRQYVCNYCLF